MSSVIRMTFLQFSRRVPVLPFVNMPTAILMSDLVIDSREQIFLLEIPGQMAFDTLQPGFKCHLLPACLMRVFSKQLPQQLIGDLRGLSI